MSASYDEAPRFLIRDRDGVHGEDIRFVASQDKRFMVWGCMTLRTRSHATAALPVSSSPWNLTLTRLLTPASCMVTP